MAKELLLYTGIYSFTAEALISAMEENKGSDMVLRVNSPGGSVFSGWGIIAKMGEIQGQGSRVLVKVDGAAMSMSANLPLYADDSEALDVSNLMIHRADGPVETDDERELLNKINMDLRKKMEASIDEARLKEIKGVGFDEIFDPKQRINVFLSAYEAKAIGLIKRVVKVGPKEIEAMNDRMFAIAAQAENKPETNIKMNIEKLKAEHPELFAQVKALGASEEKDRVGAWMAFVEVDPEQVSKAVKDGTVMSQTAMVELTKKSFSAEALKAIEKENPKDVKTEEVKATGVDNKLDAFEAKLNERLGFKTENK